MDPPHLGSEAARPGSREKRMQLVPDSREERTGKIPERYFIRDLEKGRVLTCSEAPTLEVHVEPEFSISAAAARKSPPGSIFLDGAAQGEPFLDIERQVFNLDHHEGCVRAFTLATCEQATVLVRMGLDLRNRDWTIYANEPDLDTILAVWVLLNHIRLNADDPVFRQTIMPILRLQGTIDAHGLELQELVGFPPKLYLDTFAKLERLRAREVELKREGRWQELDALTYTLSVLREVDHLVYSPMDFEETLEVQELVRKTVGDHWLVIACRSKAGIYEVEQHLRRLHGERLGIIALRKNDSTYTLRRVNHFLPANLETIYRRLNARDPNAGGTRSGNRWGGSAEIGGSPRTTGTALTAEQIVEICGAGFTTPRRLYALGSLAQAILTSFAVLAAAVSAVALHEFLQRPIPALEDVFYQRMGMFAALLAAVSVLLFSPQWRRLDEYGLQFPSRFEWLPFLPAAAITSLAGGAWFPAALSPGPTLFGYTTWAGPATVLAFAVLAEFLFRGLVHGILARDYSTQKTGGGWFLSWPVLISSAAYAFWALAPFDTASLMRGLGIALATFLFGICCGMARERSGSLLAPILIHCFCLLVPVLT